jgi:C-8 sterol isomerase
MSKYIFDPGALQEIANFGAGLPMSERWDVIHKELARRYPGKVYPKLEWMFNSAGNLVCQLALVYASPSEYVAFFGTPIGATGFSGRYPFADVWDLMVAGEMRTYIPGQMEPTIYCGGDPAYLPRGQGKGVAYIGSTWMIDYARGPVITMLPFGVISPTLSVTLDYHSMWQQLGRYGKLVILNMLGRLG